MKNSRPLTTQRTRRIKRVRSGLFLGVLRVLRGGALRSRILAVLIAAASLAAISFAQSDLTGRWLWRLPNGDGTFRETVFVLNAEGAALTGTVITPTSEQPMVDGGVDGTS